MTDDLGSHRMETLRAIPLFEGCTDASLERLLAIANEFEAGSGHVLAQPNEPGAGLFILEEGTVAVDLHGSRIELGPGEFFGELALLDERATHVARVSTTSPIKCLAIRREDFDELLASEPHMAVVMLRTLARRLAATIRG
jgi:CPA1 family monovalent cation:H+ antiporter